MMTAILPATDALVAELREALDQPHPVQIARPFIRPLLARLDAAEAERDRLRALIEKLADRLEPTKDAWVHVRAALAEEAGDE